MTLDAMRRTCRTSPRQSRRIDRRSTASGRDSRDRSARARQRRGRCVDPRARPRRLAAEVERPALSVPRQGDPADRLDRHARPGSLDSFNPRWTEYTGLRLEAQPGPELAAGAPPRGRPSLGRGLGAVAVLGARTWRSTSGSAGPTASYRWHLARASPVRDRSGRVLKWLGTCTDIDDQKRAEGMLGFLAEVSTVLASSLDYETTLAAVARMAVPHVADWCVVDMLEPDGATRRLAVAHPDPAQGRAGLGAGPALSARRWATPGSRSGCSRPAAPRSPREVDDAVLVASARDPEHLAMLRAQGCTSSISAALAARGRTLGVITFAMAESGRRYSKADLPLVEDLARRAAMAVDNARLYREAQPGPRGGRGRQPGQGPLPRRPQPRAADPADARAGRGLGDARRPRDAPNRSARSWR